MMVAIADFDTIGITAKTGHKHSKACAFESAEESA
jgi:hypothetical protein